VHLLVKRILRCIIIQTSILHLFLFCKVGQLMTELPEHAPESIEYSSEWTSTVFI